MLAKHCLQEFKLDCQLRRLTDQTIKGYCNNTLNFLIYPEKHHGIHHTITMEWLHVHSISLSFHYPTLFHTFKKKPPDSESPIPILVNRFSIAVSL